jgi:uncharacterized C2H2 Zn-finger protein
MAQQIVTLCDVHLADDIEEPGRPWSVTIQQPGGKPTSYTLDVCEEHGKPLAELVGFLRELGRPVAATVGSPEDGATCPTCGKELKNRGTLSTHVRQQHGTTLTELTGGAPRASSADPGASSDYVCPECGDTFSSPQGIGVHRSKKHGVRGAKSKPGKAAS